MSVNYWCYYIYFDDFDSIYRLCFTLRADEFLGCYSNYEFMFCNSSSRSGFSLLDLRWFLCR